MFLVQFLIFGLCPTVIIAVIVVAQDGINTIGGMQPRYLIPLIYPALALMGSNRMRNHISPAAYNGILFAGMIYTGMTGIFFSCIEYYH